jgi:hypothetical protein
MMFFLYVFAVIGVFFVMAMLAGMVRSAYENLKYSSAAFVEGMAVRSYIRRLAELKSGETKDTLFALVKDLDNGKHHRNGEC